MFKAFCCLRGIPGLWAQSPLIANPARGPRRLFLAPQLLALLMGHLQLSLCIFEPTEETNPDGWRKHRCTVCGYVSMFIPPTTGRIVRPCGSEPPAPSVGTELLALNSELGLEAKSSCGCAKKAAQMDAWGIVGCRAHRAEIIEWLREGYEHATWLETIRAGWRGMFTINPLDPFNSLLDEAIRRTEAKDTK